ncbi:hypothetical protein IWW34DRAFT_257555 [Fusarium oxysporum f. sp. albedinis]|nr:hypothetical protein IWW34DRAFT_257555 [Fusarium oxysporum f. sp. albedinis]
MRPTVDVRNPHPGRGSLALQTGCRQSLLGYIHMPQRNRGLQRLSSKSETLHPCRDNLWMGHGCGAGAWPWRTLNASIIESPEWRNQPRPSSSPGDGGECGLGMDGMGDTKLEPRGRYRLRRARMLCYGDGGSHLFIPKFKRRFNILSFSLSLPLHFPSCLFAAFACFVKPSP